MHRRLDGTFAVNEARRQAVMAVYNELAKEPGDPPLYMGVENLRRRVPRSEQEFAA